MSLDERVLLPAVHGSLERALPVNVDIPIVNINRSVGTILSSEISKRYGALGLPENTISLNFSGVAGQSFMAFGAKGSPPIWKVRLMIILEKVCQEPN